MIITPALTTGLRSALTGTRFWDLWCSCQRHTPRHEIIEAYASLYQLPIIQFDFCTVQFKKLKVGVISLDAI